jgi:hypothetical protein
MASERTLVEVWMGTFDEADFCPLIYPVRHIYPTKREGSSEGIILLLVIMDKNGEEHCSLYLHR